MKLYTLICLSFLFILQVSGQCVIDAADYENESPLTNKHRSSLIFSPGHISGHLDKAETYSFDGEQLLMETGYVKSLWIGGSDPAGNLKFTGLDYLLNPSDEIIPGPYSNNENQSFCDFYKKIWLVTAQEVDFVKNKFSSGNLNIQEVPIDILSWPAKNNRHLGKFTVNYDMAPFFDFNEDDIYDPLDGDYPLAIQEQPDLIPSAFNFSVFSSNINPSDSWEDPVDLEIHQVNYVFDCQDLNEANHSVFTSINLTYKGNTDLRNARIGVWQNVDLGCDSNDYIGCSPDLNTTYTYNKNTSQEFDCFQSTGGLTEAGAVFQAFVFFNTDIISYLTFDNGFIGYHPITARPAITEQYNNYLNGLWLDGTPMTNGGIGFNLGSNDTISFLYPDLPNEENGWSMETEALELGNWKSVTSFYEGTITPGQQLDFHFADHIKYSPTHDRISIFDIYEETVNQLKNEHEDLLLNGNASCQTTSTNNSISDIQNYKVYPNPFSSQIEIEFNGSITGQVSVSQMDGRLIHKKEFYNESILRLELSDMEEGIYILEIKGIEGVLISEKIVKF